MIDDLWASLIIASAWILLAIGAVYAKDAARALWALRHSKTKPIAAWPCDTILPCQSWVGREITAPVVDEAVRIAEYAWDVWEASPVEGGNDD